MRRCLCDSATEHHKLRLGTEHDIMNDSSTILKAAPRVSESRFFVAIIFYCSS